MRSVFGPNTWFQFFTASGKCAFSSSQYFWDKFFLFFSCVKGQRK